MFPIHGEVAVDREHGGAVIELCQPHEARVRQGHRAYFLRSRPTATRSTMTSEVHAEKVAHEKIDEPLQFMAHLAYEVGALGEYRLAGQEGWMELPEAINRPRGDRPSAPVARPVDQCRR